MMQALLVLGGSAVVQCAFGVLIATKEVADGFEWWKLGWLLAFALIGAIAYLPLHRWRFSQPDWLGMASMVSFLSALLLLCMWRWKFGPDNRVLFGPMAFTAFLSSLLGYFGRPPECMLPFRRT